MTQLRWHYSIHPGTSWFESFAQHFSSPDIRIWPQESEGVPDWFGWSSHHLDDVTSKQELDDRTASLKAIFDGALFIDRGPSYHPVDLTNRIAERSTDTDWSRSSIWSADVRVCPFSTTQIAANANSIDNPLGKFVSEVIFLARYDEITRAILKYTGVQGLSYFSLYAYRDWMKKGGWRDARIAAEAGWSIAKLGDFTNTANNPAYLGPYSRHGGIAPLPNRPMPLEEAEQPMRKALKQFLINRSNLVNLTSEWQKISS